MEKKFILGLFDDEVDMVNAVKKLDEKKIEIYDCYTPFPVHGLDDLLKIKRTKLPYVTFAAGAFGCLIAILFQAWVSVSDWPINIGGKPMLSFAALIPVTFEITILLGALVTVFMFFARSGLFPGKEPELFDQRQTCHKFIIAIEESPSNLGMEEIMKSNGATETKEATL